MLFLVREIQSENRQLKASIEEHQRAIELIMSKYREHTQRQIRETKLDFERLVKANENNNVSWIRKQRFVVGVTQNLISVLTHHQLAGREASGGYRCDARSCQNG